MQETMRWGKTTTGLVPLLLAIGACCSAGAAVIVLRQFYLENNSFAYDWHVIFGRSVAVHAGLSPFSLTKDVISIATPQCIAMLSALLPLGEDRSAVVWSGLSAAMLYGSCRLIMSLHDWNASRSTRLAMYWFMVSSVPAVLLLIAYDQETAPVMLTYALGMWLLARRHEALGGACFAIGLLIKPQVAFLSLPVLLYTRQWRAVCGFLLAAVAGTAMTTAVVGLNTFREYQGAQETFWRLNSQHAGTWFEGLGVDDLFHFEVPYVVSPEVSAGLVRIVLIGLLAWYWREGWNVDAPSAGRRWAATVLVTILITPYCHYYDAVLLIVPALVLGAEVAGARVSGGVRLYASMFGILCLYLGPEIRMLYSVHVTALGLAVALVVLVLLPEPRAAQPRAMICPAERPC